MSTYYDKQIPGELWLRDLKNSVKPSHNVLSSIYLKYQEVHFPFFCELTANRISRFDVFYDSVFIETVYGCIFEKIYIENENILPFNQINLFNIKKTTTVDYWFDERKNKIFFTDLYYFYDITTPSDVFEFIFIFKVFDAKTGLIRTLILDNVTIKFISSINWDPTVLTIENPKITYNSDTKLFNVSFILRNSANTIGIISLNVLNSDEPRITEVNGFLPYAIIDAKNCNNISLKELPTLLKDGILTEDSYNILTELVQILGYDAIS
jgi:hypothetical protein